MVAWMSNDVTVEEKKERKYRNKENDWNKAEVK